MNIIVWEYFINFMEVLLFFLFIRTKLHINTQLPHNNYFQFLFLILRFIIQCVMNHHNVSTFFSLTVACLLEMFFAFLFYEDSTITKFFWGFMYSVICMIAEYISMFIPRTFSGVSSPEILLGGELRVPYSMLYIALVAVLIFLFRSFGNKNLALTPLQKLSYLIISIAGILIGYYIMILTMRAEELQIGFSFTFSMILVNFFFIFLFLFLLVYIYQLGYSKKINIRLLEEQKLYKLEELEYNNLIQTTETLREMKHDINIHLDVMHALAIEGNNAELLSYIQNYHHSLEQTHHLLSTGNTAIDCILSSKIHTAKQLGIEVDFSVISPPSFPIDALSLSSLLGNLWNNALEACQRLKKANPTSYSYIRFYIKPFQQMVLIHIENTFDGKLKMDVEHYISLKTGSDHGIGLKRIYHITKKANGIVQIDTGNNIFKVHIMLPMKEVSNENENNNS